MNYKERLIEWAENVSNNKKDLDKMIFDDVLKYTLSRLDNSGFDKTYEWLKENYEKGINNSMKGPVLLARNSEILRAKLWSLKREEIKKLKNGRIV